MTMKREVHMDEVGQLRSAASQPRRADSLDVIVCGELLVERHERAGRLEFVLFGALGAGAAASVEAELLDDGKTPVLVDLTHLDFTEPSALCRLVDRQREEHLAGRQLLLRIAPEQVTQLNRP